MDVETGRPSPRGHKVVKCETHHKHTLTILNLIRKEHNMEKKIHHTKRHFPSGHVDFRGLRLGGSLAPPTVHRRPAGAGGDGGCGGTETAVQHGQGCLAGVFGLATT